MPLQATSGAASYDAFGGGVVAEPNYIESCFSTWLYNGGNPPKTITNGIDLAGKGGLVWTKARNIAEGHRLVDTVRGATKALLSNETGAQVTETGGLTSFSSTGYVVSFDSGYNGNTTTDTYASWTFREQPKFFDVVTYTGNGASSRNISHSLGSTPGMVIVKRTDSSGDWVVWHRSLSTFPKSLLLNTTDSAGAAATYANGYILATSSTTFSVEEGTDVADVNASGGTYVAYLFAHNAGGFGLSGTDNVISCGSFTGGSTVNLGYEPQWLLVKVTNGSGGWLLIDNMRGFLGTGNDATTYLEPNTSNAESSIAFGVNVTPTGFTTTNLNPAGSFIYIAIRRGPMKTPTTGTSVFAPATYTGNGANQTFTNTVNNGGSLVVIKGRNSTFPNVWYDQLRGAGNALVSNSNSAALQADPTFEVSAFTNKGFSLGANFNYDVNNTSAPFVYWQFVRAPGFFDEVCYTSTAGFAASFTHNLGVTPELIIFKNRQTGGGSGEWMVYSAPTGNNSNLVLNTTSALVTNTGFIQTLNSTTVLTGAVLPQANQNYVSYLFATCPGVSKVFSYTGNGTSQTINCGFTGGARFVLLKASSATGGWYVYDTARGMTVLTDPYLQLNSTAAETATLGSVTTVSTGFAVNEAITTGVNTSGVTYIGLAIS